MSDVTRYDLVATMGGWTIGPDPTGRLVSLADYAKAEADHLAALERVRVETLREVWTVVDREQAWSLSAARMQTKCLAALDRLFDATTTPVEGS